MTRQNEMAGPGPTGSGLRPGSDTPAHTDVESPLAWLAGMATKDLRAEWQRLHRATPPRLSRDLLIRAIAYKIQERANGGPNAALKRRLRTLAGQLATGNGPAAASGTSLKPGARLVREWRGRMHMVTVTENGFEYDGERYRSLSQIAKRITGAHWSGPRFFGLTKANAKVEDPDGPGPGEIAAPGD